MKTPPLRVALTGAAGQIAYALLFRLASGEVFGRQQALELSLIEVEPAMAALEGVAMELEDGAFPLLKSLRLTADVREGFRGANWAILVGSLPRRAGMERSDLLSVNGRIFVEQGAALEREAADNIRVLVVGNPCNTNCLIALRQAPAIPQDRWMALMRLDENRAKQQLALKAGVEISAISRLCVWGNHSSTLFPDFYNARVGSSDACSCIGDEAWLKGTFVSKVAQRGAAIIEARGASSAASAAKAVVDTLQDVTRPTSQDDFHSVAICSQGQYGTPEGIITSLPVRTSAAGKVEVVPGLRLHPYAREKIKASNQELLDEIARVKLA